MRSLPVLVLAVLPGLSSLSAQTLTRPNAVLQHEFSQISGFIELRDGRVLVSDRIEERVSVGNFTTGQVAMVGRKGSGPAEYRLPAGLVAWTGDSVLLIDEGNARLSVIGPDARILRSFVLQLPGVPTTSAPRGVDARGRIYVRIPRWAAAGFGLRGDSIPIVRLGGAGARPEVIAWTIAMLQRQNTRVMGHPNVIYSPQDAWAVAPDGRVAIARTGDYHVEWLEPDGRITRGPPVPYERLPVTLADRRAYIRRFLETSNVGGRGGEDATPSGLSAGPAVTEEEVRRMATTQEFAEVRPPFTDAAPFISPAGEFWVQRSLRSGSPEQWDVFDRAGRLVRSVRLPADRRLLGLGRGALYAAQVDEDGVERVERYGI